MRSLNNLPLDLLVCNCTVCGVLLSAPDQPIKIKESRGRLLYDGIRLPPYVHMRLDGQPYCFPCFSIVSRKKEVPVERNS